MERKYIQTLVVTDPFLAMDLMRGLKNVNPDYSFDITETKNDHGVITQVKIEIYKMLPCGYEF